MGGGGGRLSGGFGRSSYNFSTGASFVCKVDSNNFDEATVIPTLQQAIEQSMVKAGVKITNRDNKVPVEFSLAYSVNEAEGKLTVSARRVPGAQYSFVSSLQESRK